VAEIKIERKRRPILPWIIGLVLLLLVLWGLVVANRTAAAAEHGTARTDMLRDDTPPRLRQYALATEAPAGLPETASRAA
jgi:hypothetical protein